ncbi:Heterokaryon incompatibility protein 6,OR allele [Lachnellula occidentalis]|uniref:Heterokaryon incompatibility protein 6,OR allele n=1 Tax=Lachnellula occidentalis TaxID=215460 RepID=A0A8H8S2Q0_9HELO|nr:Heterokaryon incompatibility protein 6,OR allele [Lachnellula occidentalis]
MANSYQYSPFPDMNSIRLIYLEPWRRDPDEPLRCQLRTASLDTLPPYEAISYAWGEPIFSREILVDGGLELAITPSLGGALQRMRGNVPLGLRNSLQRMRRGISRRGHLSSSVRILWADAICINQQDIDERSRQVQSMRKIYQRASRVLVWLDSGGPEVPVALGLIDKIIVLRQEELARTGDIKVEHVSAVRNELRRLPNFDSPDVSILRTFMVSLSLSPQLLFVKQIDSENL